MNSFLLRGAKNDRFEKHLYIKVHYGDETAQINVSHDHGNTFVTKATLAGSGGIIKTSPNGKYVACAWNRIIHISKNYGETFEKIENINPSISQIRNIQLFNNGRIAVGVIANSLPSVIVTNDYTLTNNCFSVYGHLFNRASSEQILVRDTLNSDSPSCLLNVFNESVINLVSGVKQYVIVGLIHSYTTEASQIYVSNDSGNVFRELSWIGVYVDRITMSYDGKYYAIAYNLDNSIRCFLYDANSLSIDHFNNTYYFASGFSLGVLSSQINDYGFYFSGFDTNDFFYPLYHVDGAQIKKIYKNGQSAFVASGQTIAVNNNFSIY